jgi:hypothetical protein
MGRFHRRASRACRLGWSRKTRKTRNSTEDAEGALALVARARRRRLPAWPEVIPGAPGSRPKKRGLGAPGMQPVLSERTPPSFFRVFRDASETSATSAFLCVLCGALCPLCSAFWPRDSRMNQKLHLPGPGRTRISTGRVETAPSSGLLCGHRVLGNALGFQEESRLFPYCHGGARKAWPLGGRRSAAVP